MLIATKQMQNKRQSLYFQMKQLNDSVPHSRTFTAEERQKWDRMESDYDANLKTLQSTLKADGRRLEAMAAGTPPPRVSRLIGRDGGDTPSTKEFAQIRAERQQRIERQLIEPQAAMSGTLGTSGGNLIGETLVTTIEIAMLDFSGVLQA